jgi:hypothetical protein
MGYRGFLASLAVLAVAVGWTGSARAASSTYTTLDLRSQRLTTSTTAPDLPHVERRQVDGSEVIVIQTLTGPITLHSGFNTGTAESTR